jgi:hypothetical protein
MYIVNRCGLYCFDDSVLVRNLGRWSVGSNTQQHLVLFFDLSTWDVIKCGVLGKY